MSNKYDYLFKLVVIGDTNIGKSCLLSRFIDNYYSTSFISTIGVDFKVKTIKIDNKLIKIQIWDTAGQCRFRTITNSYYRGSHGIFIVYDISNRQSFNNIEIWIRDVNKFVSDNTIKMLIGTKSDLNNQRKVSKEEAQLLADKLNMNYIETSAKDNININDPFINISKELLKNYNQKIESNKEINIFISENLQNTKNRKCC